MQALALVARVAPLPQVCYDSYSQVSTPAQRVELVCCDHLEQLRSLRNFVEQIRLMQLSCLVDVSLGSLIYYSFFVPGGLGQYLTHGNMKWKRKP